MERTHAPAHALPAPARGKRSVADGAYRTPKAKVLRIALDLFSTRGYSETKMADIAAKAGLSVGALYLRFKNKEELFWEIIQDQSGDFIERTKNLSLDNPLGSLRTYIALNIDYALRKRQLLSIFYREYNLKFLRPLRRNFFKTQHGIISDILSAGVRKGIFIPMDITGTASMIFASLRGAILLRLVFGIGDAKTMSSSLFTLITNGIRKD